VQPRAQPGDSTRSGGAYEQAGARDGDEYASRVAKYIPGEVLAAYLTLEGLLSSAKASGSAIVKLAQPEYFAAGIFLVGLIFTPLYIRSFAGRTSAPWRTHAVMATLAFAVWAYAMNGSVFQFPVGELKAGLYEGTIAAIVLVVFSLVSGLIKPPPPNLNS
jgi:hypothetical protein